MWGVHMQKLIESATWVTAPRAFASPVFVKEFSLANKPSEAKIALSALGMFKLYINGKAVGDEYFRPSGSLTCPRDFSNATYPILDQFTYRSYYSIYDVAKYLVPGDNLLEIQVGNGWYRQTDRTAEGEMSFGDALGVIFALTVTDGGKEKIILSDETLACRTSEIIYNNIFYGEKFDSRIKAFEFAPVTAVQLPETILSPEIAPADRVIRRITPKLIFAHGESKIYDAGENITGLAEFTTSAPAGTEIRLRFAEVLSGEELNFSSTGSVYKSPDGRPQIQEDAFVCDGEEHRYSPTFVWHGFRYIEITGEARDIEVLVIHNDVPVTSAFVCDIPELNWLYSAYIRSQLGGMHMGYPSDCPHRERLGYTGDGQVCAPAAMLMLDGRDFYRKWTVDIFDSQDKVGGHVNHTAPFAGGGGGPGGWGMAAINVPYYYYKLYGDISLAREYYGRMKNWISYLEKRMESGLIVREEDGGWCLGDWAALEKIQIPEPFVNTCLFISSLGFMAEMAEHLGEFEDGAKFKALAKASGEAVKAKYLDPETGSFALGVQGADAFALNAGLGDGKTVAAMEAKYAALGHFDTGFICTDILPDMLFTHVGADLPVKMMASHEAGGYGYIMDLGATTVWEHWVDEESHNHPMFGACARHLFGHILGIGQAENSAGFEHVVIAPKLPAGMMHAAGHVTAPKGKIAVKWHREASAVIFEITTPEGADFVLGGTRKTLKPGTETVKIEM